jgi:hypothetical protein
VSGSRVPARVGFGCLLALTAVVVTGSAAVAPPSPVRSGGHPPSSRPVADPDAAARLAQLRRELTAVQAERQSRLLEAEDQRLFRLVSSVPFGSLPYTAGRGSGSTVVLTPAVRAYGLADLEALGAAVANDHGSVDLVRHVLVAPGATLRVAAPGTTLRMRSDGQGFVSVVAWKAALVFTGGPGAPLTVTSWSPSSGTADPSPVDGRAYLRTVSGSMTLDHVRVSDLGFWSGRTGGAAWTGSPRAAAAGAVAHSTVTGGHYGLFAAGSRNLRISDSAFVGNDVDGIALHRRAVGTVVTAARAVGNGRHGVSADLGSEDLRLSDVDVSRNAASGLSFSGAPLAAGPTAGGASTRTYGRLSVTGGRAEDNGLVGLRIVHCSSVSVRGFTVDGGRDGIVLVRTRFPTVVRGAVVRGAHRFGISLQNGVADLEGNRLSGGRTAIRVQDARGAVRSNDVRAAHHYGVSVSGASAGSVVVGNTLLGRGPAAVDTFRLDRGADVTVRRNEMSHWTVDEDDGLYWSRFVPRHPMVVLWLVVLFLPLLTSLRARSRRTAPGTLPYADQWRGPRLAPRPTGEGDA